MAGSEERVRTTTWLWLGAKSEFERPRGGRGGSSSADRVKWCELFSYIFGYNCHEFLYF